MTTVSQIQTVSRGTVLSRIIAYTQQRGYVTAFVLSTLVALALAYLAYSFLLSPMIAANVARETVIARLEAENRVAHEIELTEPDFKREFRKAVELYVAAQPLLPQESEMTSVLAQVEQAAHADHVLLVSLSAFKAETQSPTTDKVIERELPAVVTGAHRDVEHFLEDVARLKRIVLIREMKESSGRKSVVANFTLVAYHAPSPQGVPPLPDEFRALLAASRQNAAVVTTAATRH